MSFPQDRFFEAQQNSYAEALSQIQKGRKESHWMWYIFPQLKGLGQSNSAQFYGLDGLAEAQAYLENPVLGKRLIEITEAALKHPDKTPLQIFGYPDNLKFHSCLTLFERVPGAVPVFRKALDVFFAGKEDPATLRLLKEI